MDYQKQNALNAIAKKCNDEMNPIDKSDLSKLRDVADKYAAQAELLGFSKMQMMRCIGVMNGVLVDR